MNTQIINTRNSRAIHFQKASSLISVTIALILASSFTQTISQNLSDYSFTALSGTFTQIKSMGGETSPILSAGSQDDGFYNAIPLGFAFTYLDVSYITVSASTNGWMTFGPSIASNSANANDLSLGGTRPLLAPLWDDHLIPFGNFSYITEGTAGTRVFTAEWLSVQWFYSGNTNVISFQVRLYEGTNRIEFVYRQEANLPSGSTGASIGITDQYTGMWNFISLDGTGTLPNASFTTETSTIATRPATGQIYSFIPVPPPVPLPPIPGSPADVATHLSTAPTLMWNSSAHAVSYSLQVATDGTFTSGIVLDESFLTDTIRVVSGLTANTVYYWRVNANNITGTSSYSPVWSFTTTDGLLCVSTTGNDANSGSAGAPLRNVQTALTMAVAGDSIKVAGGSYNEFLSTLTRVILQGGYTVTFEESSRDIFVNKTIIEGVSTQMITDQFASTIDGFIFNGNSSVTDDQVSLYNGSIFRHNIVKGYYNAYSTGIKTYGGATVLNNTLYSCYRGIEIWSGTGTPNIRNNILEGNSYGMGTYYFSSAERAFNNVHANVQNYASSDQNPGVGDISQDPVFRDPAGLDFRIRENSPCLNAGNPTDPAGEEPAQYNSRIDIGAYGGTKYSPYMPPVPGAPVSESPANGAKHQSRDVTLKWYIIPEVSTYHLQVATDPSFASGIEFDDAVQTDTLEVMNNLSFGTTYYWRISATVTLGTSPFSDVFSFTTTDGVLCVSTSGNDANSGSTGSPLRFIQTALNRAAAGDTIKVTGGTYSEFLTTARGVILLGGYTETFEESERDIFVNMSIIEGVGTMMFTDQYASTIDGFFFKGNSNVTDAAIKTYNGSIVRHNVIRGVSSGNGITTYGGATVENNSVYACTFGIWINSGTGTPVITNNIVSNGSWGMYTTSYSSGVRPFNDVYGNSFNYSGSDSNPGTGDISQPPQFRDVASNDFRILEASPCVNKGDPADPSGNEPVQYNSRIDIGAYGGTRYSPYMPPVPVAPDLVSPLNGATHQSRGVTLRWNMSPEVSTYHLQVATDPSFASGIVFNDSTRTDTLETLSNLSVETTFYWRVRAKVTLGTGSFSNVFSFTTTDGVLCVSTSGSDANSGSELAPLQYIPTALSRAVDGDTVKIALGSYNGGIFTQSQVIIRGGYSMSFKESERNMIANKTTLQGISSVMFTDTKGSTIDGFFFLGSSNVTDAAIKVYNGSIVRHNVIRSVSSGNAIETYGGATVENNTLYSCTFGIDINSGTSTPVITNNIVADGSWGMYTNSYSSAVRPYNDVYGNSFNYSGSDSNPGIGDISQFPQFQDAANNDFRLLITSPCINIGNPGTQYNDPDGTRNDLGAFFYDEYPATPQDLSAVAGINSITLTWQQNTEQDFLRYRIYAGPTPNPTTVLDSIQSISSTSFILSGLPFDVTYYFRLTAIDQGHNESPFSNEVSALPNPSGLQTDSLALVAIYNSTNGTGWTTNTNWLTGTVDTWYGVTVFGGRVTELNLSNNNLSGPLPAEIGNLTVLQHLDLYINQLSGSLPPEIGNLASLNYLDLDNNPLTGIIPVELGNLVNLQSLWLGNNQLTGNIPGVMGNLINLQTLGLYESQYSGNIPPEMGNLINLNTLYLENNQLSGNIPSQLGNLSNLRYLYLYGNQLSGSLPVELGNIYSLRTLNLYNNLLTGNIPASFGNLVNLHTLSLSQNQLSGSIPVEIGILDSLENLWLGENQFTGNFPPEIANCSQMIWIYIGNNQLTGDLPFELTGLSNLKYLYVENNLFTGLPDFSLIPLTEFRVSNNYFTFEDLELNVSRITENTSQLPFGSPQTYALSPGSNKNLNFTVGGLNNLYQWEKDGSDIPGANLNNYDLVNATISDSGIYKLKVTNTVVTGITLTSAEISIDLILPLDINDSLALVNLYNSTNGSAWTFNTNWLSGNADTWYGITVINGRATEIDLNSNNLYGNIPPDLGNLIFLRKLNLAANQLTGNIPVELGNLSNLNYLSIEYNQLTGIIPDVLGNLINLTFFTISGNQLTGSIPYSLGYLTNLQHFWIHTNLLTGIIPVELGNLYNAEFFSLANNQLSGSIPSELGNLYNVKYLDLSSNQLSGNIPPSLGNLSNLQYYFGLNNNQLTGDIPSEIGNLSNLQYLTFAGNQLTGIIPPGLGNLNNLVQLDLTGNQLSGGIPVEFGNLTSLQTLLLGGNTLGGNIPNVLGNLVNLQGLGLWGDQLTGTIPVELSNLGQLQYLGLDGNQLTGNVPAEFGNLHNLTELKLSWNLLSGPIPAELVNMVNLGHLYLNNNNFADLPDLSSMPLTIFTVSNNQFTFEDLEPNISKITENTGQQPFGPTQVFNLTGDGNQTLSFTVGGTGNIYQWEKDGSDISGANSNSYDIINATLSDAGIYKLRVANTLVTGLNLSSNQIIVNVTFTVDLNDSLALVDLYNSTNGTGWTNSSNWLTGNIDTWYGVTITNGRVTGLNLSSNNLAGNIPVQLGNLTNLLILNISNNQLTGDIPGSLGNLVNLQNLYFDNNQLSGPIPSEIGNLNSLTSLFIQGNLLSGSIPSEIGNLSNLAYLFLGGNNLGGSIPSSLGNLTNLEQLWLWGNQFTGNIPPELGNLANLQYLDLNSNQLTGTVPAQLGNLVNLKLLKLCFNQLEGIIPGEFTNLTQLGSLCITSNNFIDLPDLSLLPLTILQVSDNLFTFEALESNVSKITENWGQKPFGTPQTYYIVEGGSQTLSFTVGGSANQYQWQMNGSDLPGATSNFYEIFNASPSDEGIYNLNVTNSLVTGITLTSQPLMVLPDETVLSSDSLSLVALYNSTNGTSWNNNSNWLLGNVDTWYGVTVAGGRVAFLDLSNNNLNGTIPPEIGNLGNLINLQLDRNQITGSIPSSIGNLTNLIQLWFDSNQLSGTIPSEFGNLTSLQYLGLSWNQLSGTVPSQFGNIFSLTGLYINNNQFTGVIPTELGNLSNLKYFNLSYNQLSVLPGLSSLANLKELNIKNNLFTFEDIEPNLAVADSSFIYSPQENIGTEIDTLLYVGSILNLNAALGGTFNQYQWTKDGSDIPSQTNNIYVNPNVSLIDAGIYACRITSTLATELTLFSNSVNVSVVNPPNELDSLALVELYNNTGGPGWTNSSNWLTGPVNSWWGIGVINNRVTSVSLGQNNLSGTLPSSFWTLDSIHDFSFWNNPNLTGSIESGIGNMMNLNSLDIRTCQFTGTLPSNLGNLQKLQTLNISENNFSGNLPAEFWNLISLKEFSADGNGFTGSLPPEIQNLDSLQFLSLSGCSLSGSLPVEIGNLSELRYLNIRQNNLSGSVPGSIGNLSKLTELNLAFNQLDGPIPPEIGNLTDLENLVIDFNSFTGTIPASLGNLLNLNVLYLDGNQLSGAVPGELANLTSLTILNLYDNELTDLPDLSNLSLLTEFGISNNYFTFEDLEPNITIITGDNWQKPFGTIQTLYVAPGGNLIVNFTVGGSYNQYQWDKDGSDISGAVFDSYDILNASNPNIGTYKLKVSNTLVTGLTLYSAEINVQFSQAVESGDSLALVSLYNSTNGPGWTNNENWLTGYVESWYGVTMDNGRVTALELPGNNLTGTLPVELGNLPNLQFLSLGGNQLSGSIPVEFGYLGNLQFLWLSENQLSGSIPAELGNLANLQHLELNQNLISGNIPAQLGNLGYLLFLGLADNQLTGSIPSNLGNMTSLQELWLYGNQLAGGMPSEIGNLTNLLKLGLEGNSLSGNLPVQLTNLFNLQYLALGDNLLSGSIPAELGNLANLEELWISGNLLSGSIPIELGNLPNLRYLALGNNQLTGGIPTQLGNLVNLQQLDLGTNQLSGSVPLEFVNLSNLMELFLNDNNLIDVTDLSSLPLSTFTVSNNMFTFEDLEPNVSKITDNAEQQPFGTSQSFNLTTGSNQPLGFSVGGNNNQYQWEKDGSDIPGALSDNYNITNATFLDEGIYLLKVTNTVVTGITLYSQPLTVLYQRTVIPDDSLALVALYQSTNGPGWTNSSNWLTGNVDTWYGVTVSGGRVARLDLFRNQLIGNIPVEIGNLASIEYLNLGDNQFPGSLPIELGNLGNIRELILNSNQFTGSIPVEFGNLAFIENLDLNSNQISGNIRAEFGNLTHLLKLNLCQNQLSGNIPGELGNLANLNSLILYTNFLSGNIPGELGNLGNLIELLLFNNQLTGNIPVQLTNLVNLQALGLHENQLVGNIPGELGNLSNLRHLRLENNQLTGGIPSQIGNLTNLQDLRLNDNQLTGVVPVELGILTNLLSLHVENNYLYDMPDLSGLTNLTELTIDNNRFTFEDIEPNINVAISSFIYSPQDSVGQADNILLYTGDQLILSVTVGGTANQYQWSKDGSDLSGENGATYIKGSVIASDSGFYSCRITNSLATALTLYSKIVNVNVLDFSQLADLTLSNPEVIPSPASLDSEVSLKVTVSNIGLTDAASSSLGVYLSNNSTWDDFDQPLTTAAIPFIASGNNHPVTIPFIFNSGTFTIGSYYIVYKADISNIIIENNEINNEIFSGFELLPADNIKPVLGQITFNDNLDAGFVSADFSLDVTDNSGIVQSVFFKYKGIAAAPGDWKQSLMDNSGSTYSKAVNENEYDHHGIMFYIVASDLSGNKDSTELKYSKIVTSSSAISVNTNSYGSSQFNYRIISIPYKLNSFSVSSIFFDDFGGAYDSTQWRLFSFDGLNSRYIEMSSGSIARGKGYFLINKSKSSFSVGEGTNPDETPENPFQISLDQGWNLIGNPYLYNVGWDDIISLNGSPSQLNGRIPKTFEGSFLNSDRIKANGGVFIFSDGNIKLDIPVFNNPDFRGREPDNTISFLKNRLDDENWEVMFNLSNGTLVNNFSGIGMRSDASDLNDPYDDYTLPRFMDYLELNHEGIEFAGTKFTRNVVRNRDKYTWTFNIESAKQGEGITVNWDNSYFGDKKKLVLFDVDNQVEIDMLNANSYTFISERVNRFRVLYGNPEDVKTSIVQLLPSYPNPFSDLAHIRLVLPESNQEYQVLVNLFNSTGGQVKTLYNGTMIPGTHDMIWNGTDFAGHEVPGGMYIVTVKVKNAGVVTNLNEKIVKQ